MRTGPNDPCSCGSGKKYKRCHGPIDLLRKIRGTDAPVVTPRAGFQPVHPGKQSPRRTVPAGIVRPDYAENGKPLAPRHRTNCKNAEQLLRLRKACRAAREVLDECIAAVRPGITTDEIDRIAHEGYIRRGGFPSTLNYHHFPKSCCTSVNEIICHGIPDDRALLDGDIVNVDVTIYLDGMHGDCSATALVGNVDEAGRRLVAITRDSMYAGIGAVRPGAKLRDIGRAIQQLAEAHDYGVVRAFVGHGIGEQFHQDPQMPHYYEPTATQELIPGMTFTVEPMINEGTERHVVWDDQWTAVTADLKRSAQFEHTIVVTERGVEILTLAEGEAQPFPY